MDFKFQDVVRKLPGVRKSRGYWATNREPVRFWEEAVFYHAFAFCNNYRTGQPAVSRTTPGRQ